MIINKAIDPVYSGECWFLSNFNWTKHLTWKTHTQIKSIEQKLNPGVSGLHINNMKNIKH